MKKMRVVGFEVRVEVPEPLCVDRSRLPDYFARDAATIRDAIKRHVDDIGHVYIHTERESVCEHCGRAWTEVSETYNGGCCAKDEANAPKDTP